MRRRRLGLDRVPLPRPPGGHEDADGAGDHRRLHRARLGELPIDLNRLRRIGLDRDARGLPVLHGAVLNLLRLRLGGIALSGVGSKDRLYEDVEAGVEKTIRMLDGLTAFLVFYGPEAMTYAQMTQVGLHEDTVREKLRMDGIALVDNSPTPVWLPELYNGNWLNRCDLEVRLYRMVEYTETLPAVQVVPEIIIRRDI